MYRAIATEGPTQRNRHAARSTATAQHQFSIGPITSTYLSLGSTGGPAACCETPCSPRLARRHRHHSTAPTALPASFPAFGIASYVLSRSLALALWSSSLGL
jgi:hypothetical protein